VINILFYFRYPIPFIKRHLGLNYKEEIFMEWVPYSQFTNIKQIAEGGFGIIYKVNWLNGSINDNDYSESRRRK
jgi:hypothetical protein